MLTRITAAQARENTDRNTIAGKSLHEMMAQKCFDKIEKESCDGSKFAWLKPNEVNAYVLAELKVAGFSVEFKKGPSLLDADYYNVTW